MRGDSGQSFGKALGIAALGAVVSLYAATPALAQANVGVSVSVQQPGLYGRIDIGNYPNVQLVYPQPVVIAPTPIALYRQPIYCTFRSHTNAIGAATAAGTTPAASRCTLCRSNGFSSSATPGGTTMTTTTTTVAMARTKSATSTTTTESSKPRRQVAGRAGGF